MNTINTSMTGHVTMDGQALVNATSAKTTQTKKGNSSLINDVLPNSAAEVTENINEDLAETEANVHELQKLSNIVPGHKLHFNVNNDSGKVVVEVIDPSTNETIREIPSKELQTLQERMKQAIGLIFDENV